MHRACRSFRRVFSRGAVATLRGALLSERVEGCATNESEGGGGDAEGDSRPRRSRGSVSESQADRREAAKPATVELSQDGSPGRGGDVELHELSP